MRYFLQFTLLWLGMLGSGQSLSDAFSSTSDASPFSPQQSQFLPVTEAYQPLVSLSEAGELDVNWQITEAYYLYQKQFSARWLAASAQGTLTLNYGAAEIKDDPYFGEMIIEAPKVLRQIRYSESWHLHHDFTLSSLPSFLSPVTGRFGLPGISGNNPFDDVSSAPTIISPIRANLR